MVKAQNDRKPKHKYTKIITAHLNTVPAELGTIPGTGDLCPSCNWDWTCHWPRMQLHSAPFSFFTLGEHALLDVCHVLSPLLVSPTHFLDFLSSPAPSHKPSLFRVLGSRGHSSHLLFHPSALPSHALPLSLSFLLELYHIILCHGELLVGQVVETEGADGKLDDPRFARRSLLED